MHAHALRSFTFLAIPTDGSGAFPDAASLKRQIAQAVIANSEVTGNALGFYTPPEEIRELRLTSAAFDQVRCRWHAHRQPDHASPPAIALKAFVTGFGQDDKGHTWASIEVHPGEDRWEPRS